MRKIEFRVWSEEKREMEYSDEMDMATFAAYFWNNPKYSEWMQYTGLKDINNKEIYEGDIVKSPDYDNIMIVEYQDIVASDDMTAPGIGYQFSTEPNEMEIVGNIHENPELLEE